MRDEECVCFLQWALPRLGMRWAGFRKVRSQVCKRIARRMGALGLDGLDAYRARLDEDPHEWRVLDRMCRITISRLWRDSATFTALEETVLPELAARAVAVGAACLDVWSCGCASGEEPYSLSILWAERLAPRFPGLDLRILATDIDLHLLQRAGRGVYTEGAAREVPAELASAALEPVDPDGRELHVAGRYRTPVDFAQHDVREGAPGGPFHLVLCRNLVFTYYDEALQHSAAEHLLGALQPGGALAIGGHEKLPAGLTGLEPWPEAACIFRRVD